MYGLGGREGPQKSGPPCCRLRCTRCGAGRPSPPPAGGPRNPVAAARPPPMSCRTSTGRRKPAAYRRTF